jgi:hypothetical protein
MEIKAIDDTNTLFSLHNLVDQDLVDQLQDIDWASVPTLPFMSAQHRKVVVLEAVPLLQKVDTQMRQKSKVIAHKLGLEFDFYYNDFWIDFPGWSVPLHVDSQVFCSWQSYWFGPENTGTTFYTDRLGTEVKYQASFSPNTGYFMLNMPVDGAQPLNWHDMKHTIPEGQLRLTSYTRLGPYHARTYNHH